MITEEASHIISLNALSIGHEKGNALLSGLNLSVNKGEMVALIGRNGTGKSTLLKSMIGLITPLEGDCTLDGLPFQDYPLPSRARKVSFVSSHFEHLPALSVGELVALGRMPYTGWMGRLLQRDRDMIRHALNEVRMGSFERRKLDCLSDGERQRAMIARALVQDTPLMVLDEPTAFLDIPNTYDLIRLLSKFRDDGRSIVYSTHDLETAMQCADKMWVIHGDRILEGAPEDLGITGLFSELFSSSGIRYDEQAGKFLFTGRQQGRIHLEGAGGETRVWTQNALQRLGFVLDKNAPLKIRIEDGQDGKGWILHTKDGTVAFKSLYSLARFLKQD
jgi:iron complex transport system ATP-binding protein